MRKYSIFLVVLVGFILTSCDAIDRKYQEGSAVVVNGKYLYYSTLDSLTLGLSTEDSIRVAQQYISQWAKDIVMYDAAKARTNPSIERLVEDYRRSLYVHAYEEHLVEQNMPKTIIDSTITQLYDRISGQLLLDESIFKGLLVVYPNDAPKTQRLKRWAHQIIDGDGRCDFVAEHPVQRQYRHALRRDIHPVRIKNFLCNCFSHFTPPCLRR